MIVQIPDDVCDYEPKLIGHFTTRQLICIIIAFAAVAGIFIPLFLTTHDENISALPACLAGVPIITFGFIKRDGLYMEQILRIKLQELREPTSRPYRMHNWYEDLSRSAKEAIEIEALLDKEAKTGRGA